LLRQPDESDLSGWDRQSSCLQAGLDLGKKCVKLWMRIGLAVVGRVPSQRALPDSGQSRHSLVAVTSTSFLIRELRQAPESYETAMAASAQFSQGAKSAHACDEVFGLLYPIRTKKEARFRMETGFDQVWSG
jgi:hypothetical protein